MRCILIQDPSAVKGSAALDVRVGSSLDPKTMQGTAHFLEHMVFQGTEKYPGINEYADFMQNAGGMKNGCTTLTNTNFHFDCANPAFEEGLDRFAQFFISPNFSESGASREISAINSEFNQGLQ
jgi:insulysin